MTAKTAFGKGRTVSFSHAFNDSPGSFGPGIQAFGPSAFTKDDRPFSAQAAAKALYDEKTQGPQHAHFSFDGRTVGAIAGEWIVKALKGVGRAIDRAISGWYGQVPDAGYETAPAGYEAAYRTQNLYRPAETHVFDDSRRRYAVAA